MDKRRLYWLLPQVERHHQARANLLEANGYDVTFFHSADDVRHEIIRVRAGIFIVSDNGPDDLVTNLIQGLVSIPETRGARLFLSVERGTQSIKTLAAANNFRDLLPINLDQNQWLQRFDYSAAAKPIDIRPPQGQVTMNNISAIHVPARLVWIGRERIRLETSLTVPIGSEISLGGAIAERLGIRAVAVRVQGVENSYLRYRFSDAIVGTWRVPEVARRQVDLLLDALRANAGQGTCRVFVAARSTGIRSTLFSQLIPPRFEINAAIKTQAMIVEPKYFSPDIAFIEDTLCTGKFAESFTEMLGNIPQNVPIVVIGDSPLVRDLVRRHSDRRIVATAKLPASLLNSEFSALLQPGAGHPIDEDAFTIGSEHELSIAKLMLPARLAKVHPLLVQVDTPYRLRRFALCHLSSPMLNRILGRDAWIKVTEAYHNSQAGDDKFESSMDAVIVDCDRTERAHISNAIIKVVSAHLAKLAKEEEALPPSETEPDRTPELGSIGATAVIKHLSQIAPKPEDPTTQPAPVPLAVPLAAPQPVVPIEKVAVAATPKPKKRKKAATEEFADWFTPERVKQLFVVGIVVSLLIVMWIAAANRDEKSIEGRWFSDQILKFAPHKKPENWDEEGKK